MKDVTILIPCYNEARFIEKAILSAVSQAEYVLISDNNSTDGTQEICRELATQHSNVIFFEQKKNIGVMKNLEFLLSKTRTKYVMHVGAHDFISENYVFTLKESLENNSHAVLSYAPYFSINDDGKILEENLLDECSEKLISKSSSQRVLSFIENRDFIFTFFGLIKTQIFRKYYSSKAVAGMDSLILSQIISEGSFVRVSSTHYYRRVIARHNSGEAYMKRLEGDTTKPTQYDLSYMCTNQFKLLKEINKDNLEEQKKVLIRATMSMQRLYGKYCHKSLDITLEKLSKSKEKYILYGAGTTSDYILEKLPNSILFIVDQDLTKQNTSKNGIEIKSPTILNQYENKIIISLLGRFELISEILINEYKINSLRFILPIDYKYKISS